MRIYNKLSIEGNHKAVDRLTEKWDAGMPIFSPFLESVRVEDDYTISTYSSGYSPDIWGDKEIDLTFSSDDNLCLNRVMFLSEKFPSLIIKLIYEMPEDERGRSIVVGGRLINDSIVSFAKYQ